MDLFLTCSLFSLLLISLLFGALRFGLLLTTVQWHHHRLCGDFSILETHTLVSSAITRSPGGITLVSAALLLLRLFEFDFDLDFDCDFDFSQSAMAFANRVFKLSSFSRACWMVL